MTISTRLLHKRLSLHNIDPESFEAAYTEAGIRFSDFLEVNHNFYLITKILFEHSQSQEGRISVFNYVENKNLNFKQFFEDENREVYFEYFVGLYISRLLDGFSTYLEEVLKLLNAGKASNQVKNNIDSLLEKEITIFENEETRKYFEQLKEFRDLHTHAYSVVDEKRETKGFGSIGEVLVIKDFDAILRINNFIESLLEQIDSQVKKKLQEMGQSK